MRKRQAPPPPETLKRPPTPLSTFAVKAFVFSVIFSAVFAVGLSISLNTVLPDVYSVERLLEKIGGQVGSELEKDRNRIRLVGFLTHNPYVHYRISQLDERAGRLENAIEEIELALGLFELGPPNNPAREKYLKRLNELQRKKRQATPPHD